MSYNKGKISEGQLAQLFSIEENHFNDFKSNQNIVFDYLFISSHKPV